MKRLTKFYFFFLILVLICIQVQACHSSSTIAIKDNTSHAKVSVEPDKSLEPAMDLFSIKLKFQDNIVRAGLLYDLVSDTIFWEKNMHEAYPIASLTKMMVGLLVVEDIYAGKITWETMIRVTPEATRTGGFTVSLRSGSSFSVEDLLKAALISSGNDAAYLLAQFLGGTEKKFVIRMNQRAGQLGMKSTRFSNSTGMPARHSRDDNHSSPSDLLILCKEMLKYDELLLIARTSESSISEGGKTIKLRNQNRLVASFDEVDGFKTGFTLNAKFCLAATANKNGRRIIAIALGFDSQDQRNQFVGNMLSQCYDSMGMGSLQPKTLITMVSSPKTNLPAPPPIIHRVKRGDTLYAIAKTYSCSIAQIKSWNRLQGNVIKPGQKLKINLKSQTIHVSVTQPATSNVIYYKVQPGDTLWRISQKYKGISVHKLMQINGIKRAGDLKAGTTIKIVLEIG
jgi:serine-type D-Ala-D-Ala carboxypeptidase (penicillin-binding protein 5/6)